ncbi:MAG: hypothetical protein R3D26_16510 [Cyanobacteriota/Melainabacteria group bacterium]
MALNDAAEGEPPAPLEDGPREAASPPELELAPSRAGAPGVRVALSAPPLEAPGMPAAAAPDAPRLPADCAPPPAEPPPPPPDCWASWTCHRTSLADQIGKIEG